MSIHLRPYIRLDASQRLVLRHYGRVARLAKLRRLALLLLFSAHCIVASFAQDDPARVTLMSPYDWSGFYVGGHLGYAWGSSNWTAVPGISGALNFAQPIDNFRGRMGNFQDALALSRATGLDANDALAAVRTYQSRPGVSLNVAQQVTDTVGVFGRAGWADGNVEPWDNTDCDRTIEAGVSLNGKRWNRPDDTFGIAGVINGISSAHTAYFNAGGLGIVIGDGKLPHPGLEQIIETYYSYALCSSIEISLDYQFIRNPAYNTDRGPVNVFGVRFHWHF